MLKRITPLILLSTLIACTNTEKTVEQSALSYPNTKKTDSVDTYFGTNVPDPYRWLEDDKSAETGEWVKAQNKVTFDYLATIPFRDKIKNRLTQIWNFEKTHFPF